MTHIRKHLICLYSFFVILGVFLLSIPSSFSLNTNQVHVIQLDDDTINPVTAEYIIGAIAQAELEQATCLIIKMDTPGGLLNSTRMIVKAMMESEVPLVVYIAPKGSRAGSAGVFITYASHIAAMAPSTNIGAAHPVQMGGEAPKRTGNWDELRKLIDELREGKKSQQTEPEPKEDSSIENQDPSVKEEFQADEHPMESKILQDTLAFIRSIAKERNRNVEWAELSVAKSNSITSEEALEKGVIEIIAENEQDLLKQLDGRVVTINGNEKTLYTKGAFIQPVGMTAGQAFFNVLANPNIAYLLMILGFYGLLFEVTHPGFGVPGVLGSVFLILALYSMQTLPTNYAGLALMILGIILLITEAYTPTFGVLTTGGLACMVLGSLLLFDTVDPIMQVSISVILAFSLTTAGITLFLVRSVIRAHRAKVRGGVEGFVGEIGEAKTPLSPGYKGKVFVHGELWNATSSEEIEEGQEVIVESVQGLLIQVKKK